MTFQIGNIRHIVSMLHLNNPTWGIILEITHINPLLFNSYTYIIEIAWVIPIPHNIIVVTKTLNSLA